MEICVHVARLVHDPHWLLLHVLWQWNSGHLHRFETESLVITATTTIQIEISVRCTQRWRSGFKWWCFISERSSEVSYRWEELYHEWCEEKCDQNGHYQSAEEWVLTLPGTVQGKHSSVWFCIGFDNKLDIPVHYNEFVLHLLRSNWHSVLDDCLLDQDPWLRSENGHTSLFSM